jgi:hypothetical protein
MINLFLLQKILWVRRNYLTTFTNNDGKKNMDDRRLQKRVLDKIGCNVKTWTFVVKEKILDVLIMKNAF